MTDQPMALARVRLGKFLKSSFPVDVVAELQLKMKPAPLKSPPPDTGLVLKVDL